MGKDEYCGLMWTKLCLRLSNFVWLDEAFVAFAAVRRRMRYLPFPSCSRAVPAPRTALDMLL